MKLNGIDFDTYLKNYPDEKGYFGKYGGAYISDELKAEVEALAQKIIAGEIVREIAGLE